MKSPFPGMDPYLEPLSGSSPATAAERGDPSASRRQGVEARSPAARRNALTRSADSPAASIIAGPPTRPWTRRMPSGRWGWCKAHEQRLESKGEGICLAVVEEHPAGEHISADQRVKALVKQLGLNNRDRHRRMKLWGHQNDSCRSLLKDWMCSMPSICLTRRLSPKRRIPGV